VDAGFGRKQKDTEIRIPDFDLIRKILNVDFDLLIVIIYILSGKDLNRKLALKDKLKCFIYFSKNYIL
jgi:hypothetical protein